MCLPSLRVRSVPTAGPTVVDETNTAVIARLDRATQYSRDAGDEWRRRGVLDTRLSGYGGASRKPLTRIGRAATVDGLTESRAR